MKRYLFAVPGMIVAAALGCGKAPVAESDGAPTPSGPTVAKENPNAAGSPAGSDGDTFRPSTTVANIPAKELPVTADSPPETVVTEFLNALRAGNDGVTAGLLTTKAREETAKHNLAVQPPGTPSATYEVTKGQALPDDPNMAQVNCLWTEKSDDGKQQTDEIAWLLRKESGAWRVAGMATRIPGKDEPIFLDFEDPVDMMRVWETANQEVEAALAKQETPSKTAVGTENSGSNLRQAQDPSAPGNTLR